MSFESCMLKGLWMGGRTDGSPPLDCYSYLLVMMWGLVSLRVSFSSHICISIKPAQGWSPAWSEKAFSGKNFHTRGKQEGPVIVTVQSNLKNSTFTKGMIKLLKIKICHFWMLLIKHSGPKLPEFESCGAKSWWSKPMPVETCTIHQIENVSLICTPFCL